MGCGRIARTRRGTSELSTAVEATGRDVPDGVYWWLLEVKSEKRKVQSGGLTIRRKLGK
jgi:hypothetical protein